MPLLYRTLVLGLVPQPQIPTPSLSRDDLQRAFFDVTRAHPYQQLVFVGEGANFVNPPDDLVVVQPGLIQIRTPVTTMERTREKVIEIASAVTERIRMRTFVQSGVNVVATLPLPGGGDAREFMAGLMGGRDRASTLGPEFFDAGLKYRAIDPEGPQPSEQVLLIEPFVQTWTDLWLSYDVQRPLPVESLDVVSGWVQDAFNFMEHRALEILETQ